MRRSKSFLKTRKEAPADETARNAQLLIRAGFIHKEMAGVYVLLPLGLRVVENIKTIVREEMDAIGGEELTMTTLQRKEVWDKTDRWDDGKVDIWFKSQLKNNSEVGLAWSHEEPIAEMMSDFIASYRDLPAYAYQFQTKLRNEVRAKSGVMRSREFIMKDLYSFSVSEEQHQAFYDRAIEAYHKVFQRLGLGDITYLTYASGQPFTQFSHEFQTILPAGEDTIYIDKAKKMAVNEEVMSDELIKQLSLDKSKLEKATAAEVGNIFSFGTGKSEALGLTFTDEKGEAKPVTLGSYGIGITRLMGVMAEYFSDDSGLVWTATTAPYQVYLARLGNSPAVVKAADEAFKTLSDKGVTVMYDDRDARPGEMFSDADLIGLPVRLVVSDKTVESGCYELKARLDKDAKIVKSDALIESVNSLLS